MGMMDVRKRVAVGGLALALAIASPAAAVAENLADALSSAYNNSGLLTQYRAVLRAADEDVAVAVSALRPVIGWSGSVEYSKSRSRSAFFPVTSSGTSASLGLGLDWVIWNGGSSRLTIDAKKEAVLATRAALVGVEQNILLQAVDAYMSVRSSSETVALRQNNVRVITEELRAAKDRFEVGEVTRTDVAQAEARLAAARSAFAQAQGDLVSAQEYFKAAVGRRPGALVPPPAVPATAKTMAEAKSVAVRNHPDVKKAQHEAAAADLVVAITRASAKPTVSIGTSLGLVENFDSTNFAKSGSVSLEVTGPIYAGGKVSALYRQAIANRDSARANLLVTSQSVERSVGTAFSNLKVARAARTAFGQQVRAATVAFRGVREEATLGARTTLDVLNAEQELLDAQASLISARNSEYVVAYSLLEAMGLLTAEHLKLQVQRYDEAAYYNQVKNGPASVSKQGRQLERVLKSLGKK
ncbi:TolC family outer membrane protein [Thalassovita sp.]|uniref:TolC family outer membrane protein n=1 Tax=Thalassovita sp. TaxID=1979401 RepID=UPI002882045D|nr:TolC family outer membrane protein [Thalassovita sp.]MDF1803069.1 TolC family outer membrane protein [Thalassovita sp.]